MSVSVLDRLFKERVFERHHRTLRQLTQKPPQPQAANRERTDKIERTYDKCSLFSSTGVDARAWSDQVKHIDGPKYQNEDRDRRQPLCPSLEILLEQDEEREGKMEEDQDQAYCSPAASHSRDEPFGFFRNVCRPDDQEMDKVEIRPDHYQSQH